MEAAVALAREADVVIAVMGEGETETGESRSRTALDLPGKQEEFVRRLQAAGKPVVLVLVNGQPLTINWEQRQLPAILEAWFPGVRGGRAIARTLFGEVNPSGRLTVTFPKSIGQIEYNFPFKKGAHGEQPRWIADPNGHGKTRVIGALYPFGYGLSYTRFEYAGLEVTQMPTADGTVRVKVACTVKNVGERAGAEVVQLYLRDLYASVVTYDSTLRGFEKVWLQPGEAKRVEFDLTEEAFELLGPDMKWRFEPGEFEFRIGASSEDIRLRETVNLAAARAGGIALDDPVAHRREVRAKLAADARAAERYLRDEDAAVRRFALYTCYAADPVKGKELAKSFFGDSDDAVKALARELARDRQRGRMVPSAVPLSQNPLNDHEVIRLQSIAAEGEVFVMPPKLECDAVEIWVGPVKEHLLVWVNDVPVAEFDPATDGARDFRFEVTKAVKWGQENKLWITDARGKDKWLKFSVEVIKCGQ